MFLISCFIKKKNNIIFHRENIDHKKNFDRNREKIRLHFAESVKSAFTMGNSNRGFLVLKSGTHRTPKSSH